MKIRKSGSQEPAIKALVYGKQGVGKTTFAGSANEHPELGDVLFLDIEGGMLSVQGKNLDYVTIGRNDDGSSNHNTLGDVEKVVWNCITKQPGFEKIKTLIVDSLTDLQSRDIDDILHEIKRKKPDKDVEFISQDIYAKCGVRMKKAFRLLRDSPLNVIFTALEKQVLDDSGEKPKLIEIRPNLTASVCDSIMGITDFNWYFYTDPDKNIIMVTRDLGVVRAKTRNETFQNMLGDKFKVYDAKTKENFAVPYVYNKLKEAIK
jgi:hypothetical protein